jgi:hypothetical protein
VRCDPDEARTTGFQFARARVMRVTVLLAAQWLDAPVAALPQRSCCNRLPDRPRDWQRPRSERDPGAPPRDPGQR